VAEQEDTYCPCCVTPARVLPQGQEFPTDEQRHLGCWVRHDGTGDFRHCGVPPAIQAGLLAALVVDDYLDPLPQLLEPRRGRDATLPFLRYAAQHPVTSDALLRLLVDRLEILAADPVGSTMFQRARMRFVFRGVGAAQTIAARHQDELRALIEPLLVFDDRLWAMAWDPSAQRWANPKTQAADSARPPLDHVLLRDQTDVALGWPSLQPAHLDEGEVARG
jgi:hypothetical protein